MGQTQKVAAVRFLSPDKVEIVTSACRSAGSGTAPAHTPRYLEQNAVDGGGRRQPARFSALIRLTSKRGEEAGRRRRKCVCLSCRVSSCLPELRGLQSSSAGVTQASDDSSQDYRFFTMHSQLVHGSPLPQREQQLGAFVRLNLLRQVTPTNVSRLMRESRHNLWGVITP